MGDENINIDINDTENKNLDEIPKKKHKKKKHPDPDINPDSEPNPNNQDDNEYEIIEWKRLLDNSNAGYLMHNRSAKLWSGFYNFFGLSLVIISSIIAADGIGDIFSKDVLLGMGLASTLLSVLNSFLNPGSKYMKHKTISKKYRNIYHQVRRCDNVKIFFELQNEYIKIEQEAPDIPFFFIKKRTIEFVMNPYLQEGFKKYFDENGKIIKKI